MFKSHLAASVVLALSSSTAQGVIHLLSDAVKVDTSNKRSIVTITRTGTFHDPRYGEFELTQQMFDSMIKNFNEGVFGQEINIDIAHKPEDGAGAVVRRLFTDRGRLRAEVEWYELGINKVTKDGFKYLSAEIHPNYVSNEAGQDGKYQQFGPTLLGAGLVTRPCIKNLDKIELSEASLHDCPTYLSESLANKFSEERQTMWKQLIALFEKQLKGLKLTAEQHTAMVKLLTDSLNGVSEEEKAKSLSDQVLDTAKLLSASGTTDTPVINLNGGSLTEEDVVRILGEQATKTATAQAEQQQKLEARVKIFTDAIDNAEGLSDDIKKELKEAKDLITTEMTEEQVTKLAENQISHGNQKMVSVQLGEMGFGHVAGSVTQTPDQQRESLQLQSQIHSALRNTNTYSLGQLNLTEEKELPVFARQVLAEFDRLHHRQIHAERLALTGQGGANVISDTELPVSVQREVIREALSDLNVLQLVQTLTDFSASATTNIPYENRDVSAIMGDGIVFEHNTIPKVKNSQRMDLAYVLPMKVAFEVSNELMHFSKSSTINWDAWGRNVATASRIIKELVARRIVNTMQRVADSHLAAKANDEDIAAQLQGAYIIKTAQFPIVAPHQQYDLQGNTVGAPENPITLTIDGQQVQPFDGSGKQTAGTYYVVQSYNLGKLVLVDEAGELKSVTATNASITYSYATNIVKVDSDIPDGMAPEKHYNKLLQAIGRRKAIMKDDRFVTPDFLLMSNTLNDTCTNAETFVASMKRSGTDTTSQGDLEMVKSLPAFSTNAPATHLGDERIIMGQKGALTYTVVKPFTLSEMQEARDANGQLKGGKEAYGEEYNAIHCPKPIRNRFTSVLFYSATSR
ncbi:hypothetical protein [Vibrio mediterranei]|uniref:Uncharacterized protein n=1 Tax=Vibrio mediterranei TaxID=689 RepID=A0A3G4V6Y2_9VIBR|nr:hypothetical protein [Vibrio mediterranei]AYV20500.1 hypothetical protein ECB94_03915 [Vibrio mediterranei]